MESLARGEDVGSAEAGTLGAICDAFPTALLTLDADGVVRGFNAAWARAMGTTRMAAAFSRAVHPEDRARSSALLHGLCDARGHAAAPARERLRLVHPSGDLRWFDCAVTCEGGSYFVSLVDVTIGQRRESALKAHLRGALGLLDGMPGLLYRGRNNRSWTMEIVSAGCELLTGYPPEWFVNSHEHSFSQLILPAFADYVWHGVQAALAGRVPFELRYRIRCADGTVKAVFEKGVGIYSEGSEVLGIEGAIFEVREDAR